jgi:hypothetical protein
MEKVHSVSQFKLLEHCYSWEDEYQDHEDGDDRHTNNAKLNDIRAVIEELGKPESISDVFVINGFPIGASKIRKDGLHKTPHSPHLCIKESKSSHILDEACVHEDFHHWHVVDEL